MARSFGADGLSLLEPGQWQASVNYRYLATGDRFIRDEKWENSDAVGARMWTHSFDVQLTYSFSQRFSATLTLPFVDAERSTVLDHDGTRHKTSAGGLGDIRLVGNALLFDPQKSKNGNISLGAGIKLPTGNEKATDVFYKPTGPEIRPVDQAIQPGDGGWGMILELAAYQKLAGRLYGYAECSYLINPREQNSAITTAPYPPGPNAAVRRLSVPDQYTARAGLSCNLWPEKGVSLSLGGRIDGVPARDLTGGSEGFRRPGYAVYIEPGVSWTHGQNTFNLFAPVRVAANRQDNIYDDRYGTHGAGAFADFLIFASVTRRF
jgi:hypothetical protein